MALANTFWIDVYRAQLDDYARKVSEFAQIAERAGTTDELMRRIAIHREEWLAAHRTVLDRYAAKVDECRLRAENAGYTKDHPVVEALSKHAAAARMDFPNPWAPNPEIPQVEIPRLDITELALPELPAPPRNT